MNKILSLALALLCIALFSDIALSQKKTKKQKQVTKQRIAKPTYGTLAFEAGVYYQLGGLQKFSRSNFMLLNKDLSEILSANPQTELAEKVKRMYTLGKLEKSLNENVKSPWFVVEQQIAPHIIAGAITDFDGRGRFEQVKPGNYYLVHIGDSRGQFIVWNVSVSIVAGNNSIILDQNNAEFSR